MKPVRHVKDVQTQPLGARPQAQQEVRHLEFAVQHSEDPESQRARLQQHRITVFISTSSSEEPSDSQMSTR